MRKCRVFFKCYLSDDEPVACVVAYYGYFRRILFWEHWFGHMIDGFMIDGSVRGDGPTRFGDKYHSRYDTEKVFKTKEEYQEFKKNICANDGNVLTFFTEARHHGVANII